MMVAMALATGLGVDSAPALRVAGAPGPVFAARQLAACPAVVSGQLPPREPFRPGSARVVPVPSSPARPCPIPLAGPLPRR